MSRRFFGALMAIAMISANMGVANAETVLPAVTDGDTATAADTLTVPITSSTDTANGVADENPPAFMLVALPPVFSITTDDVTTTPLPPAVVLFGSAFVILARLGRRRQVHTGMA